MRSGGKQIDFAQDKRRSCPCECSFKHAHGPCKDECGDVWTFSPMKRSNHWLKCIVLGVCSLNLILAQAWPNCWSCWHHTHLDCTFWYILQIEVHRLWSSDVYLVEYWNKTSLHTACSCFERAPGDGTFGGESVFRCCAWVLTSIKDAWNCHWRFSVGCIFQEPLTQSRTVFSMRFTQIHRNSSKRK